MPVGGEVVVYPVGSTTEPLWVAADDVHLRQ